MNKFYALPKIVLWIVSITLAFIGGMPLGITMMFSFKFSFLYLLLFPVTLPLAVCTITPLMRVSGYYIYYSPMLLGIKSKKKLDLHNGTSFDYILYMKLKDKGIKARNKLLSYFLEGLLKIIQEIENGKIKSTLFIEGTSYFFSDSTAKRLGFTLQKPLLHYHFNFILNFIDLTLMYSYSKGRFTIPRIFEIKRAVISPSELCAQKDNLRRLLNILNNRIS
ncbi:MAG: hypothetical protein WC644_04785 [Ignavibacteria bacterium]